jgi:hypothetical protein
MLPPSVLFVSSCVVLVWKRVSLYWKVLSAPETFRERSIGALRNIVRPRLANIGRLVREEIAVASGGFRILVDGDDDCLNVLIAPTFSRSETTNLFEREWRRVRFIIEPFTSRAPKGQVFVCGRYVRR